MGVDRTDYLMWGARVPVADVRRQYAALEPEMCGGKDRRFDLVYDGMSGEYAIAGRIVCASDAHDGIKFREITGADLAADPDVIVAVHAVFPHAGPFALLMFSHYS